MEDEKIMKMKSLRSGEEIFLVRSCLKDGMTQEQAKTYVEAVKKEVKNNHETHNKNIKRRNKEKGFKTEFEKLKNKN